MKVAHLPHHRQQYQCNHLKSPEATNVVVCVIQCHDLVFYVDDGRAVVLVTHYFVIIVASLITAETPHNGKLVIIHSTLREITDL